MSNLFLEADLYFLQVIQCTLRTKAQDLSKGLKMQRDKFICSQGINHACIEAKFSNDYPHEEKGCSI